MQRFEEAHAAATPVCHRWRSRRAGCGVLGRPWLLPAAKEQGDCKGEVALLWISTALDVSWQPRWLLVVATSVQPPSPHAPPSPGWQPLTYCSHVATCSTCKCGLVALISAIAEILIGHIAPRQARVSPDCNWAGKPQCALEGSGQATHCGAMPGMSVAQAAKVCTLVLFGVYSVSQAQPTCFRICRGCARVAISQT